VEKPERKRPLGSPRSRRIDNIKMNLGEKRYGGTDWIGLAQNRDQWRALESVVMDLRIPRNSGNLLSGCTTGCVWRRTHLHRVSTKVRFND
jgi:hypothetical protein